MSTHDLEERVKTLESQVNDLIGLVKSLSKTHLQRDSAQCALSSVVEELVMRAGVEKERYGEVLRRKHAWFLARIYRQFEEAAPDSAARMDSREIEDVSTDDEEPLIWGDEWKG